LNKFEHKFSFDILSCNGNWSRTWLIVIEVVLYFELQSYFALQDVAVVVGGFTATSWHGMDFGSNVS